MKYTLVTTPGWLLLVDLETKQVQPLENDRSEYYGITWFPFGDELVLSHSGVRNEELADIATYSQSEKGWLSKGKLTSRRFLSAPHQILSAPDGRVICTNTGRNAITVFDFKNPTHFQEASASDARWDRIDLNIALGDHLNSVYLQGDILYVVAHGHDLGSRLICFSYPSLELLKVEPLGRKTGLHNIWITPEGQRISCHSGNGSLIDLDAEAPIWESNAPIYTRGLAASEDFVVVGESQKTGRDLRRGSLSGLWILDRHSWRALDYIYLGHYGGVHEVRLLDVPDEAHHGHPFREIETLIARDMRAGISSDRLTLSNSAPEHRQIWSNYELVFGSPRSLADGSKQAVIDQLCLAIKVDTSGKKSAFSYVLEQHPGAHVSAVVNYKGSGGDRDMAALLLQPNGPTSSLSFWRHDGLQWSCLPGLKFHNLSLSGIMQIETTEDEAVLSIDGVDIVTLSVDVLGLDRCDRGLGIRWMGASVKPIEVAG